MKPTEGRRRVVIEGIQPVVDAGRYPVKRVLGDTVEVTAAIFADGHDHIAARLLYRHTSERAWNNSPLTAQPNDLWSAAFTVDKLGAWCFSVEAWIDHFDTWVHDLAKRLDAQSESTPQDIPIALRIGANLITAAAARAKGSDAKYLKIAAEHLLSLASADLPRYDSPVTDELVSLVAQYPDLRLATRFPVELPLWVDRERARFSSWYELFPRSASATPGKHGTFRDVEAKVPDIAAMGFDVLYMPPIHPIGRAFRKGRNNAVTAAPGEVGSPWAIGAAEGGHTDLLPELGTFEDFANLVRAARSYRMELALDIAFQCSPDHPWVKSHPEWFVHRPDGSIQYAENPPKKYQDIYPLNFESTDWRGLWDALYNVFEFWIDHGVRIFRVDNPHTKALPFWEWCIAEVQKDTPDAIFLAEAFTRPHVMYSLAKAGFTQSYTYFTWRTDKPGLQDYFEEICSPPVSEFFRPNVWPNTPDILHEQLQTGGRAMFMQRVILAATLSSNYGIYGPAYEFCEGRPAPPAPGREGSEEYLDSEKYQIRDWSLPHTESIAPLITLLNEIRRTNPSLQRNGSLYFHPAENPSILCYSKSFGDTTASGDTNTILVAVNLDPNKEQSSWINLALDKLHLPSDTDFVVEDLLTGARYNWSGERNFVALDPAVIPAHIFRIVR
jgi:starch synthase (maltosyl-transferring)